MPSRPIVAVHILNALIGILSLTILTLVAHTLTLTSTPPYVRGTGRAMLLWPGCGGLVDMMLFIVLWPLTTSSRQEGQVKKLKYFWNGLVFVVSFVVGRPSVVLVYTFVEHGRAVMSKVVPVKGYVTTETWACAAAKNGVRNAGSMCTELRVARYLLIPEVVLGAAMLALVIRIRMKVARGMNHVGQIVTPEVKV